MSAIKGLLRRCGLFVIVQVDKNNPTKHLQLWTRGKSYSAIAAHLNGLGLKNRRATPWEHSLVRSIVERHKDKPLNLAFSKLRRILLENTELAVKLNKLERKYAKQFKVVFDAIRELMKPDLQNTTRKICFNRE